MVEHCHTPFFDQLLSFYSSFEPILPSYFLKVLRFISQYFTVYFPTFYCLFSNILLVYVSAFICSFCEHFARLFLSFYPFKSLFFTNILSVCFTMFHFYFPVLLVFKNWEVSSFSDEISAERYFKIPHFWFRMGQFYLPL